MLKSLPAVLGVGGAGLSTRPKQFYFLLGHVCEACRKRYVIGIANLLRIVVENCAVGITYCLASLLRCHFTTEIKENMLVYLKLPRRRCEQNIKKASIVRQFRRWNPEFFRFFLHHNGEWVPKLGREGELRRRAEKRRLLLTAKQSANIKGNETKE